MTDLPPCLYCNEAVDVSKRSGWARRVVGWQLARKGGGANQIVRPEPDGAVAHAWCAKEPEDDTLQPGLL